MITLGFIFTTCALAATSICLWKNLKESRKETKEARKTTERWRELYNKSDYELVQARKMRMSLEKDVADLKAHTESLCRDLRDSAQKRLNLQSVILKLEGKRKSLIGIKFKAMVPQLGLTTTEFKHGVGPCGLTVDGLAWEELDDRYVLRQWHTDGSHKEFEYMKSDVVGRIEKHYAKPESI